MRGQSRLWQCSRWLFAGLNGHSSLSESHCDRALFLLRKCIKNITNPDMVIPRSSREGVLPYPLHPFCFLFSQLPFILNTNTLFMFACTLEYNMQRRVYPCTESMHA